MQTIAYGQECILDIHECGPSGRESLTRLCIELCELLRMKPEKLVFWDYEGRPEEYAAAPAHLKGTSAVQFISTSNITIHALDELRYLYLNVFSCKPFKSTTLRAFVAKWTGGIIVNFHDMIRL